ncbi:MAG: hypothetical protein M1281_03410 [Chloroflexi bacterium]|nr:hypothetical protein [Chloroflexota bacterium]
MREEALLRENTHQQAPVNLDQVAVELRNVLLLICLVSCLAGVDLLYQAYGSGTILGHFGRGRLLRIGPLGLLAVLAGASWWSLGRQALVDRWLPGVVFLRRWTDKLGWVNWILFVLPALLFLGWSWSAYLPSLDLVLPRFWLIGALALAGAVFLQSAVRKIGYGPALAVTLMAYAVFYLLAQYIPQVSASPLSLGWSEASRYYYASLFFSKSLYGVQFPLPFLHPSRYLLQSIPFIIPSLPLWFHRLWQVLLWVGLVGAGAALLTHRLAIQNRLRRWVFAAWAFLFFFQGPVYYHLIVCVIPVLWGFDRRHFGRSLVLVLLGSLWAGISRVNWLPVPGMLAAAFYFMEEPVAAKPLWRYLLPPAAWGFLGTAAAYAAQTGYAALSGNPSYVFGTSFTSALLWYRLLPSATYPLGVLPAAGIAALPSLVYLALKVGRNITAWHPIRWLALAAELGVLLAGGIVVSVKIGGGSNLHNLDAFLFLLAVIGGYIFFDRFVPEAAARPVSLSLSWLAVGALLISPVLFAIQPAGPVSFPNSVEGYHQIAQLQQLVDSVKGQHGEVLFIGQRQLVIFHLISGVSMVPDYEKVDLMEMAMANNQPYLQAFRSDLDSHRFSLIVTEPLSDNLQTAEHVFGEENNAWVEQVVQPILKDYSRRALISSSIEVLAPK